MILDLLRHNFEQAREFYGDRWLGFSETDFKHGSKRPASKRSR